MKVDDTINILLQEIHQELLDEEDIDLSIEEIFNVANSQYVCGALAVNKRLSFFLPYIGTFVLKNKRYLIQSVAQVGKLKDVLSPEDYAKVILDKRIANRNVMKPSNIPLIKNLSALPEDLANSRSIVAINALYKQIIEEHIEEPEREIDLTKHKILNEKATTKYLSLEDEIKDELLEDERNG